MPRTHRASVSATTPTGSPRGPLRLGGVDVAHDRQAVGHSDADALLHALADALLGAAALGDIGEWFPDTDEANRGLDSREIVRDALVRVTTAGWRVANVDAVVLAQRPKLLPYKQAIRESIAALLEVAPECVGLKAKTGEGVGEIGREEIIQVQCVALLLPL
ncbi:MAG: 2-C-methyl-D-erythritol 2,4-cyclodiphosphate synthase [Pirellulales bacterium]